MDIIETQLLLERLAGLMRAEARGLLSQHGLQPVQFEALHYLSICNRYSDTPMAVTDYLGQTKGSVSQTIKVLEKKGLIEKKPDTSDKRVAHIAVTKAGYKVIQSVMPSPALTLASSHLNRKSTQSIDTSLRDLLRALQHANHSRTFGQCDTCRHHIKQSANKFMCGLTKEPLSHNEIGLICREHEHPDQR